MADLLGATPGPWRAVSIEPDAEALWIMSEDGTAIADCDVWGSSVANAAMIVAAHTAYSPEREQQVKELVEAARGLVEEIETDGGVDTSAWPLLDEIRAALAPFAEDR